MTRYDIEFFVLDHLYKYLPHDHAPRFFIIGTGRCGTTLLNQILSSHPDLISFPGEANDLWHPRLFPYRNRTIDTEPFVAEPERFTEISLASWPSGHEKRIKNRFSAYNHRRGSDKVLFVKSAMISFLIPTILKLFPSTKFLHIYRYGPAVVESLLKKEWPKFKGYFSSQEEYRIACASYWNDCLLEIEKQDTALELTRRGKLFEISYEALCSAPAEMLGQVSQFIAISNAQGYTFDLNTIKSKNYKAEGYETEKELISLKQRMAEGLRRKGYAVGTV